MRRALHPQAPARVGGGQIEVLDQVVDVILEAAHTGSVGDGKVFVLELAQAIRIRTRETSTDALR